MAKIINLFNHKGGVSKTTTVFNLGWMLGSLGKRVIIADFDPQCNLTGMVLGFKGVEDLDGVYTSSPANNVKDALSPAFESKPFKIDGSECMCVNGNGNLFLLPGHIGIAEYETTLGIAQELSGSLLALKNLPGSIRYMLDRTAEKYNADFVLVDMSPSLGPINQNLLMTSDHFIVPLHPDYFSSMALSSLTKTLPRWKKWATTASSLDVLTDADYPFPNTNTSFIGAIVQKYRPRNGRASSAFQHWIDDLTSGLKDKLIPMLIENDLLDAVLFEEITGSKPWNPILEVADFNSLIALSQEHQVPVYALEKSKVNQTGAVWDQTERSMSAFEKAFRDCAENVILLSE
ncbi:ParA family protein [Thalassospira sp. TSL5-1]|uniref:ParA family protein n=1 Tax=Thalassospira sp. TSL5-1 TaxID=1544451 RepID=UPI00094039B1|nr:AAA family ATPase [Thalassospira sp. TSL5-1]OKH88344.1 regulatory protein [Thalassospira sp. TSL5-1]